MMISPPLDWYEPADYYPSFECPYCDDKEEKLYQAKELLELVIGFLYGDDILSVHELEKNLDNLCHLLDVDLIPTDLNIQRKTKTKLISTLEEWQNITHKIG